MKAPTNLALGFATIDRPQVAQRLIRSVRTHLGRIPIYVADQSRDVEPMIPFYAANDVRLVRMPYDIGVTASRNRLAVEIREDFFVLCDDDFIMGPQTSFDDALRIFDAYPEIGVVGGRLNDFDGREEWTRNWELYLEYDPQQRLLFSIPIQELAPRAREVGGTRFFLCDAVLNFSLMRRSMFVDGVRWDEQFKSNGEHEDFFLNLKLNTPHRVAYLPTLKAFHHHPEEYKQYRRRLRDRNEGWRRFLDKWGLDQHLEFGLGVRTIDDIPNVADAQTARRRFYVNPDLSLRRDRPAPDTLLIDLEGRIATVGTLDDLGEPHGRDGATTGLLLFTRAAASLIPATDGPAIRDEPVKSHALTDRYQLETSDIQKTVGFVEGEFFFRYDTVLRPERDLVLWYWRKGSKAEDPKSGRRLAVIVRWTTDVGAVLVWRSRRSYLDCREAPYWRPLLLELPLHAPTATWLRFDVVTDGETDSQPIATGFMFAPEKRLTAAARDEAEIATVETLALTRLVRDGVLPGVAGQALPEFGRKSRPRPVSAGEVPGLRSMLALSIDHQTGIEALYFQDWRCFGRSLVSARLPPAGIGAPRRLALPRSGWGDERSRLYGFGRGIGLLSMRTVDAVVEPAE